MLLLPTRVRLLYLKRTCTNTPIDQHRQHSGVSCIRHLSVQTNVPSYATSAWLLIVSWKRGLCVKLCNLTQLMSHTTRNTWASNNQGTLRCMSRMLHVADILCGQSTLLRHRFPTEG